MEYGLSVVTTDDHYQKIPQIMVAYTLSVQEPPCSWHGIAVHPHARAFMRCVEPFEFCPVMKGK